jgi:hypothetical protein
MNRSRPAIHPPLAGNNNQQSLRSALPVTWVVMPVRAGLLPAVWDPVETAPLSDPVSGNPNMRIAAPFPETGRPDIAGARRGNHLDPRRRGRHVYINIDGAESDRWRYAAACADT